MNIENKSNKKRQIIYIGALILAFIFCFNTTFWNKIDQHILIEDKNPGYWALKKSMTIESVPKKIINNAKEGNVNFFINGLYDQDDTVMDDRGFQVWAGEDGIVCFSGKNNTDSTAYIELTPEYFSLNDGEYWIGDSVSEKDCYIELAGVTYKVGGTTEYKTLVKGNGTFSADTQLYNAYKVVLCVKSGYSGRQSFKIRINKANCGKDFFPAYCTQFNYSDDSIEVNVINLRKEELSYLTSGDWTLLGNQYKYQNDGIVNVIDFNDGTGCVFEKGNEGVYGELSPGYIVESPLSTVRITDKLEGISVPERQILNKINSMDVYLDVLEQVENQGGTIIIAVKDDGINALSDKLIQKLHNLGLTTNFEEKVDQRDNQYKYYRNSYAAIIKGKDVVFEQVNKETVNMSGELGDIKYLILSQGQSTGKISANIILDGIEYSMNRRGMNFVILNNNGKLIDTVNFDTSWDNRAFRSQDYLQTNFYVQI